MVGIKLVQPTDFDILETLQETGERNVASNIALEMDKDRNYINTRLPVLAEYGLVTRVGPAQKSGLYELTERGRQAIEHRDRYEDPQQFAEVIGVESSR